MLFAAVSRSRDVARPPSARRMAVAGAIIVLAPWVVYSMLRFGSALPSTLAAKRAQASSGVFSPYWRGLYAWPIGHESVIALLILGILFLFGLVASYRRKEVWYVVVPIGVGAVLQAVSYGWILRVPNYPWYYATPTLFVVIVAAIGFQSVADAIKSIGGQRWSIAVVLVTIALYGATGLVRKPDSVRVDYETVGLWLKDHVKPGKRIYALEFGILGWYSDRAMGDYLGLLNPEMNSYVARGDFVSWAYDAQPDFWVTGRGPAFTIDKSLLDQPWFSETFQQVFQSGDVVVYQRTGPVPRPMTTEA